MLKVSSFGGFEADGTSLKVESEYTDGMINFIVSEKYETYLNLHNYSIEDFIALYEIALVKTINGVLEMRKINMLKK